MSQITEKTLIKALIGRGFSPAEALRIAGGEQPSAAAVVAAPARKNSFYEQVIKARVGCAYGVATCGSFAPNGVGSKQHTTCPKGRKALAAARR